MRANKPEILKTAFEIAESLDIYQKHAAQARELAAGHHGNASGN